MKTVLLSIKSHWADSILSGEKKWEYRKSVPKAELPFKVIVYASEKYQAIIGEFFVYDILEDNPRELVKTTINETPHGEDLVLSYFSKHSKGYAMKVSNPKRYENQISLESIRKVKRGFMPPQNFIYLNSSHPIFGKNLLDF